MYEWQQQQVLAIQMQMAAAAMQLQMQQQPQYQQLPQQQFGYPGQPICIDENSEESDDDDEERRTLFVANLDDRITEELLYECFVQAGPIESVRIPKDNMGKNRSFGFITYVHSCSTPYANELFQGLTLFRKSITIKFQGNSASQPPRRSLPIGIGGSNRMSDVEPIKRRSYDNSSLRGSNYPAYYDLSMNDTSSSSSQRNPFKPGSSSDWTLGAASGGRTAGKERISRVPQRSRSPVEKSRRDADHHHDRHRRNNNDRRSEQRSRHRR